MPADPEHPAGPPAREATVAELHERGMARRRAVLGDAHVDRAAARVTSLDADFQDFISRYAWGEVWERGGIDLRTRHLLVLAMMAALGKEEEFAMHVRATARTGVTEAELREVLHLVAIYAGLPAANGAFRLAKEALADVRAADAATGDGEEGDADAADRS